MKTFGHTLLCAMCLVLGVLLLEGGCPQTTDDTGADEQQRDSEAHDAERKSESEGDNDAGGQQEPTWSVHSNIGQLIAGDIWGTGPNDIFVVGWSGSIHHYDGANWFEMSSGTDANLEGVWGSGPSDVYAAGIDVSTWEGVLLHYDGAAWSRVDPGSTAWLNAIWGSGPNDVYAVGLDMDSGMGAILHYDGSGWSAIDTAVASGFHGVWGSGATNVFVVADSGIVLHFDGSDWSPMESGTTATLHGLWGSGPNDVFTVGADLAVQNAVLLHYDGIGWSEIDESSIHGLQELSGVGGTGPDDVFAVGSKGPSSTGGVAGAVLHYDGVRWARMDIPSTAGGLLPVGALTCIWGSGPNDVYAIGALGVVLHYGTQAE